MDGARITAVQALVRNLLRLVDGFPFLLPYLLGLVVLAIDPQKRRLGDILAGARVSR